jgi:predicted ATP-dependent protease
MAQVHQRSIKSHSKELDETQAERNELRKLMRDLARQEKRETKRAKTNLKNQQDDDYSDDDDLETEEEWQQRMAKEEHERKQKDEKEMMAFEVFKADLKVGDTFARVRQPRHDGRSKFVIMNPRDDYPFATVFRIHDTYVSLNIHMDREDKKRLRESDFGDISFHAGDLPKLEWEWVKFNIKDITLPLPPLAARLYAVHQKQEEDFHRMCENSAAMREFAAALKKHIPS